MTEPPLWALPAVVGVVVAPLPPLPLLFALEQAEATSAKASTTEAMVEWWRARSVVATFPPAVECRRAPGTNLCLPGVTGVTSECTGAT